MAILLGPSLVALEEIPHQAYPSCVRSTPALIPALGVSLVLKEIWTYSESSATELLSGVGHFSSRSRGRHLHPRPRRRCCPFSLIWTLHHARFLMLSSSPGASVFSLALFWILPLALAPQPCTSTTVR